MTPHYLAHALHILECIDRIQNYTKQKQLSEYDDMAYDAILRRLQTMAESAHNLPDDIKNQHSHINWSKIVGFRNVLVHNYLGDIDEFVVRNVIEEYIPPLKAAMLHHVPNWENIKHEYRYI